MAERFFSITAALRQAKLDEAWNLAPRQANTLRETIAQLAGAISPTVDPTGGVFSSSSNGHSASAFTPGSNQAATQELVEMWQGMLALFDKVSEFLNNCATYGQQAFLVAYQTRFATPLIAVNPAVLIETGGPPTSFGRWTSACKRCGVDPALVVGQSVTDEAVYVWMKSQELVSVRQSTNDYLALRTQGFPAYA